MRGLIKPSNDNEFLHVHVKEHLFKMSLYQFVTLNKMLKVKHAFKCMVLKNLDLQEVKIKKLSINKALKVT